MKPSVCVLVPFRERFDPAFLFNTWLPLYETRTNLDFCTLYINQFLMTDMPHVSAARNGLVRMASNRQPDYVYFLDADMVAENSVECLRLLLETASREDVNVVSGLYIDKRNMEHCFKSALSTEFLSKYIEGGEPFEVEAVGMGCALIDARVFAEVQYPWFKCDVIEEPGEDVYFCRKAREKGFQVWVDPRVRFNHIGLFQLTPEGEIKSPA